MPSPFSPFFLIIVEKFSKENLKWFHNKIHLKFLSAILNFYSFSIFSKSEKNPQNISQSKMIVMATYILKLLSSCHANKYVWLEFSFQMHPYLISEK